MTVRNFAAMAFYAKQQANYRVLWNILGRDWTYLAAEAVWGVQNVPGKDHGQLKIELTDEQRKALLPVLTHMGFFRALSLRPGRYDELEITGAKYNGIVNRVIDIKRHLDMRDGQQRPKYTFGRIICQFGLRPRTNWQDGTVEEIKNSLSASVLAHSWVQKELEKFGEELFEGPFATEFELGILAFIVAYDGNVKVGDYAPVRRIEPIMPDAVRELANTFPESERDTMLAVYKRQLAAKLTNLPSVPVRTVESCTLTLPDNTPVLVLNCPAVERPHGDPRPTTASSTDYRQTYYPPKENGTVVGVSGPTHGDRVLCDFENRVHARFPGVTVYGISRPAADPAKVLNNALAEAIWLLQKAHDEWRQEA